MSGANQGIGYYMVEKLLADGYTVAVLDLEIDRLLEMKKRYPNKLFPYLCDMRNVQEVLKSVALFADKCQSIDIAIHNACCCTFSPMEEIGEDIYQTVFDVNYFGALRLTKAVIPYMKRQKKGKIIFTSSGVGITGFVNISPYASSKGALESLAKCLNIEYQDKGITFHLFHPPLTRTQSSAPLPVPKEFMADPKEVGYGFARHIHSKRFIVCPSAGQKIQTMLCYRFPLTVGKLMDKMTAKCTGELNVH